MSKYRTADEQVEHLEKKAAAIREQLLVAKADAKNQARKNRDNRLITAAARIEEIVHEGGYPDWEISYPALTSKNKKRSERPDNATRIGEWVLKALNEGKTLEKTVPRKDEYDEHSNDFSK